jgi:protein-S-isoprenylcysteine O-methyltransferase Ste14
MDTKLIARFLAREVMGVAMMGVALFWSAGRLNWWPAWALLAVMLAWIAATLIVILRYNPSLLAERLGPRKGAKPWDKAIMSVVGLAQLGRLIIAGLDQRFGWTADFPVAAQIVALIVLALSWALVAWATGANAFFSQIVRIQAERGQTVATGGPYRFVRHPAYVGAVLAEFAVPVLLGSWWALLPGALNAVLMVVRTALEDRTLRAELNGYAEYASRVSYRLLPGVW